MELKCCCILQYFLNKSGFFVVKREITVLYTAHFTENSKASLYCEFCGIKFFIALTSSHLIDLTDITVTWLVVYGISRTIFSDGAFVFFLPLHSSVLKPRFHLSFIKPQRLCKFSTARCVQILLLRKSLLQIT